MTRFHVNLACLIWAMSACGGGGGSQFSYGEPRTIDVNGQTEVTDPVSGLTFIFPEGGSGTMTLTEIVSAPDRPFKGGRGWKVESDHNKEFLVRVPVGPDEEAGCWAFGFLDGSADDGVPRDGRWVPVPGVQVGDGTWEYEWVLPFEVAEPASQTGRVESPLSPRSGWRGFSQYWVNSLKPDSSETDRRVNLRLQVASDIDHWVAALPETMRQSVQAELDRLHYDMSFDGSYYIGFKRTLLGAKPDPIIGLRLDSDASIIAHEVGHYMTHVLAGDNAYLAIENTAPDANHGLGTWQPGRPLVEDYAYFSQYFLTGSVGAADPTNPRSILAGIDPRKEDVPGVEGFGCVLLASLVRTSSTMVSVQSKSPEPAPVIGASFGEVLALYASGAVTVDDLWPHLERFVESRGQAGALSVLAERAGWSYVAKGRVLDENGAPLEGVKVKNLVIIGTTEYDNKEAGEDTTDKEGRFRLTRTFPGNSTIRVDLPAGPEDFSVTIDPTTATTEEIDLGSFNFGKWGWCMYKDFWGNWECTLFFSQELCELAEGQFCDKDDCCECFGSMWCLF